MIILGRADATRLAGAGDALLSRGDSEPVRFQSPLPDETDASLFEASLMVGIPAGYLGTLDGLMTGETAPAGVDRHRFIS